ncbi:aldo/keto reductase [Jannaschia sp. R86511]|uniref:aldo/keto reductase n=1 Tax=Jannaschia sp. R86511 TaxID=3093853 RepID=UPI0036D3E735
METRRLGRLEHRSSVLVYGAAALSDVTQDVADRAVQQLLEAGINHVDVAADYGDAEVRLGACMAELRPRVLLATKTGLRDAEPARRQIEASLERLRTDRVDLLQLHAVGDLAELDLVTRPGGALAAAVQAQEEGLVGAVGITGHGPQAAATHLEALRRYPFATVLTPLNPLLWREAAFRDAFGALRDEVARQDAGLMVIKAVAHRPWPSGEQDGQAFTTWYEPFADPGRVKAAVSWVLDQPGVTALATPGDVRLLGDVVAAERDRSSAAEAEAALVDVAGYASPFVDA